MGGTVKHWNLAAREPRLARQFDARGFGGPLPSPDGSRLAFVPIGAAEPAHGFRITDGSGRTVVEAALHPGHTDDACFSEDGRTIALIWHDMKTLEFTVLVWDAIRGRELFRRTAERGLAASVSFTPDGSRVAIAMMTRLGPSARDNGPVRAWDLATGRELITRRETTMTEMFRVEMFRVLYSPDGRWVLINPRRSDDGGRRIVWIDAETGADAATLELGRHPVGDLAFRRDGRRLAVAQVDGTSTTVRVWDVEPILRGETPVPVLTLAGLVGNRPRVEFSPEGNRLLISGDAPVKLWDAMAGREVLTLKSNGVPTGPAYFSRDGHKIWAGLDEEGRIWGWDATPVAEAKTP
jgi:WD40 repeat protein